MTRTEADLRTLLRTPVDPAAAARVLARAGSAAPGTPGTPGTPGSPRRRRQWQIGVVTALAVVVVVGAVVVAGGARTGPRSATPAVATISAPTSAVPTSTPTAGTTPAAGPRPVAPDGSVVSFLAGSGYQVGATMLFPGDETVDAVPDGATTAVATVHAGPIEATAAPSKPSVVLAPGVTATWAAETTGPGGPTPTPDTLTWSVDGLTLAVRPAAGSAPGATDAVVTAVARAVVVGAPEPLSVPVSVSSWPATGWSVGGLVSTFVHRDGATGTAGRDVLIDISVAGQDGTAVTIDSAGLAFGSGTTGGTPVDIGGRTWTWDATSSTWEWAGPDRFVRVTSVNLDIGRDTLRSLVAAMTLATDFGDESTWFDATTALPSR